jgi:hypothetical protein
MASSGPDTTTNARAARGRKSTTATPKAAAAVANSTQPETSVSQVQHLAERVILIPVGAGLVVRDDIVSTVNRLTTRYVTRAGLERELRRYEKRGGRVRARIERDIRRRRTRIERDMRARRKGIERAMRENRRRLDREIRTVRKDLSKRSDILTARVEKLVSDAQELIGSLP